MLNIVKEINDLFIFALENSASDIHVETKKESVQVRARADGKLISFRRYAHAEGFALINRLRVMGHFDISSTNKLLDGRGLFTLSNYHADLRFATIPGLWGENITIRILREEKDIPDLSQLGLLPDTQATLKRFLSQGKGLLVVGGATGSGKSTTLYSLLREIDATQKKIITIENPVEYQKEGAVQIQTSETLSFANALRASLRHDPDVLLVGEIRDPETAAIAFNAALTGHLVLSTVHARNTAEMLVRIRALEVEEFQINSALELLLAQKLLPKKCPLCKGAGCPECHNGVLGRQAVFESFSLKNGETHSFAQNLKVMLNKENSLRGELFDADISDSPVRNS